MSKSIALARSRAAMAQESLRIALVATCAVALIAAGQVTPF